MSQSLKRTLTVGAVVLLVALVGTQGYRMVAAQMKDSKEFGQPADKLEARTKGLQQFNPIFVALPPSERDGDGNVALKALFDASLRNQAIFESSKLQYMPMWELGEKVSKDADLSGLVDALVNAKEFKVKTAATADDVLKTANLNPERLSVRILCGLAEYNAYQGKHQEAVKYLAAAGRVNRFLSVFPEEVGVVACFGATKMIALSVCNILAEEPLAQDQIKLYADVVKEASFEASLQEIIAGDIQRMTVASTSLSKYDEITLMQLNGPGLNVEPHPTSGGAPKAMVSQVVGFFEESLKASKEKGEDPYQMGIAMDLNLRKWHEDLQPANYLIRTMPPIYEQAGRTILRINQVWKSMNAVFVLAQNGIVDENGMVAKRTGNAIQVELPDPHKKFEKPPVGAVDADPKVGVRINVTLP